MNEGLSNDASLYAIVAAHTAYHAGKFDDALQAAERAIADNPYAVEAHLTIALVMLRRTIVAATIASLKKCIAVRSAEWILERLHQDFQAHDVPPLPKDMAFQLGAFLRSNLNALPPALLPEHHRAPHEFMNIVGTSHVRSFGGNRAFFPLFIGIGPTMLLLSEAAAAITRRKFRENLRRVDTRRNTMLVLGGDPFYYVTELANAGASRPGGATAEDLALMDAVAERHAPILADAQRQISGTLMLLCVTPMHHDLMNQLSRHLNHRLKALCDATGVVFLDWWDEVADPVTGHLRADYCVNAHLGDVHFSLSATTRFMQLLQRDGWFGDAVEPSCLFNWSHVFECKIDVDESTRIWCEPSVWVNAFQSHKIASSHLSTQVADLLTCLGAQFPDQIFLMVNVREGFLPVTVPAHVHSGCLAFTDTEDNLQVGQAVLDFHGRLDVRLHRSDDFAMLDRRSFSQVVLLLYPDTFEADQQRCNDVLSRIGAAPSIIVATPFPDRLGGLDLGQRRIVTFCISNRHIPVQWRNYSIAVVR
jgi:hypothetical protein